MSEENISETVTVSRMTVATATDLLRERKQEIEHIDGPGPYVTELAETIERLEQSLEG